MTYDPTISAQRAANFGIPVSTLEARALVVEAPNWNAQRAVACQALALKSQDKQWSVE